VSTLLQSLCLCISKISFSIRSLDVLCLTEQASLTSISAQKRTAVVLSIVSIIDLLGKLSPCSHLSSLDFNKTFESMKSSLISNSGGVYKLFSYLLYSFKYPDIVYCFY
jgi:hypothetical protein